MTLYILAGGEDRASQDYGQKLEKIISVRFESPRVLSCFFSLPKNLWEEKAKSWGSWFQSNLGDGVEYRSTTPESFLDDLDWADVIYLHGGTTALLKKSLEHFGTFYEKFKDKIVIGSSAGANFLSTTYYSPSQNSVDHGTGLAGVATIVHYGATSDGEVSLSNSEWLEVINKIHQEMNPQEQLILLPEGTFVAFEK